MMFSSGSKFLSSIAICLLVTVPAPAQRNLSGSVKAKEALERLKVLGSVLMIAAHPDDENTALLAYFNRKRNCRTAYLSITRGEGGQNLIGPEQGALLGVIRTQELLAARRIDGAEQLFTRAIDFGFSKSAEETLGKWGHEEILADVVWAIRSFRPDVIILRFSGASTDGHGHHQASAMLGKEAFLAAADKNRFPEQLQWAEPWKAKRLLWNAFSFTPQQEREAERMPGRIEIDLGEYDPVLGYSYAEIAGMSRSMHRSQGMGSAERKGPVRNSLVHVAGVPAREDVFEGIDTGWSRVTDGAAAGRLIDEVVKQFDPEHPDRSVVPLLEARGLISRLKDAWAVRKTAELDEAVALCAGLWLDADAERWDAVPGSSLRIETTALNRSTVPITLEGIEIQDQSAEKGRSMQAASGALPYNQPRRDDTVWTFSHAAPYTQPFWLLEPPVGERYTIPDQRNVSQPENAPVLRARFRIRVNGEGIDLFRPVVHRYVDPLEGELTRPVALVPALSQEFRHNVLLFPSPAPRKAEIRLNSNAGAISGEVRVKAPAGWQANPDGGTFTLGATGEQALFAFKLLPPAVPSDARVLAEARLKSAARRQFNLNMTVLRYPHIPPQVVFSPSKAKLVRADVRTLARNVGYVMGAGDEMPEAIRQLGCEVSLLTAQDLAAGDLSRFDAIVTGVRAYNVRADLGANQHRLLDYIRNGGTLLVQYNVLDNRDALSRVGPYPIQFGRDRVSVEEAPVMFANPESPLLHSPNRITAADFEGWVQERGLYFASKWDPQYRLLFESHDPGEPPHPGGTLYARYGKGAFVFTAYSWFRQLPAGVPGAYRVFANLLSAGKVLQ